MTRITICISNDIVYDRRMQRTVDALSAHYKVTVLCRKLHEGGNAKKLKCFFHKGFLFYMEFNIRVFFMLLLMKVDIITAVDYDTLIPATLVARMRGKSLVLDAHELFEGSVELQSRPRVKRFWEWVGRTFVPHVNRAYSVSGSIARYYTERFNLPFSVVRNVPCKVNVNVRTYQDEDKVIIYQGALNEGRKLEMLVKLPEYLPDNYKVWILGEGDLSEDLRRSAHKEVVFHSWVDAKQLHEVTSQAFLAYNLLEQRSQSYYLSLANKFFDYIHAGIPSLNSPFPEYEAMNERYNCCYTRGVSSSSELAEWIMKISKEETLWNEKRKNSFLAAKDLNWNKERKKLLEIYDFHSNTDI